MATYRDVYPLNMRASSVIERGGHCESIEDDDGNAVWSTGTEPVQGLESFPPRYPEIEAIFCRLFQEVDKEMAECHRNGTPFIYILKQQTVRKQRPRNPPRQNPSTRNVATPRVEQPYQTASAVVNWADTPHAVKISRGTSGPVTAFDDSALRIAYETAQWRQRAERFHVPLEMRDSELYSAFKGIQELSKPGVRFGFE